MTVNAIYYQPGTAIAFKDSGGDVAFAIASCSNGAGYASAQYDRSTGNKPARYKVDFICKWVNAPTLGDICRLYMFASQQSSYDNAAGAVTPETKFSNYALIGQAVCSVAADQAFYYSCVVEIYGRYIQFGIWNTSAKAMNATGNASSVTITPIPDDIEAAA